MVNQRKGRTIRLSHRDVLFENPNYIAINKRSGWLIHQTVDSKRSNLFSSLRAYLRHRDHGKTTYLALHHRLDLWTSGVVLFAKSESGSRALAELFRERAIRKHYVGLCDGKPPQESGELVDFLRKKKVAGEERMICVARGGQKAITRYRVLHGSKSWTRVEFELITGRMHQIRTQAASAGFPIIGDGLYGRDVGALPGQLLHARSLVFTDPIGGEEIAIQAPLPDRFADFERGTVRSGARKGKRYLAFYKPYGVLCQFTSNYPGEPCLGDFGLPRDVYPVGRLDKDSEGLVLLSNDGKSHVEMSDPKQGRPKTYWVQVEGIPTDAKLRALAEGLVIRDYVTKPCRVRRLEGEAMPARDPPIRWRKSVPTCWLEVTITEGRNRQVRRMTAAIGHPTLRLVRVAMGRLQLGGMSPGAFREVPGVELDRA